MADGQLRVYLDSCVVLRYLEGDPDIVSVLDPVMHQIKQGTGPVSLYTSQLSVTEVAYSVDKHAEGIREDDLEDIRMFWRDAPIMKVETTVHAAELGRSVIRACRHLTPPGQDLSIKARSVDAVHIGTAQWVKAQEIWTTDGPLLKLNSVVDRLEIKRPYNPKPQLFEI